jgi:hypothetical protein
MKTHRTLIAVASLPLALGLVACSSDDSGGGGGRAQADPPAAGNGGNPEDFCLNSADEVGAALGADGVTAEGVANEGLGGGCSYAAGDGTPLYALSVVTNDQAEPAFDGYKEAPGSEPVDGVGDEAIFMPAGDNQGIAWLEDGVVVSAGILGPVELDEEGQRDALLELAQQATD